MLIGGRVLRVRYDLTCSQHNNVKKIINYFNTLRAEAECHTQSIEINNR